MGCARRTVAVLVGAVVVGAACGDAGMVKDPSAAPSSAELDGVGDPGASATTTAAPARDFSDIDRIIDEFIEESELEGAGLVVVEADAGVVHEHYGGTFTPDRVSFVASSSKMVSAGVLMRLHEDGLLDLDAPVGEIAGWGDANPGITTAQLISSSSGLVGLSLAPPYPPYACQWSATTTLRACGEEIFTTTADDADVVAPDTEFRYGGGQWQVAGAVAEIASGRSWAELVEEIYVEPCGLDVLAYGNPFEEIGDVGFEYPDDQLVDRRAAVDTANPNIGAGMYTTARDYAQLLLMHLRGGQCDGAHVLSAASVDRLHADRIGAVYGGSTSFGSGYGMGWWIDRSRGWLFDGGAYGADAWLDLDDGYGAFLVVEAITPDVQLSHLLHDPLDAIMSSSG